VTFMSTFRFRPMPCLEVNFLKMAIVSPHG
jgi:hypothetical protein